MNCILIAVLLLCTGCTASMKSSLPPVTATQQLITSIAEARAVRSLHVDLPALPAFIETDHYTGDQYMLGLFTQAVLDAGVPLAADRDHADTIIVVLAPVGSIDAESYYLGLPPIPITPLLSIPSISAYSKTTDIGIARIRYFAFDRQSGDLIGDAVSKYGVVKYSQVKSLLFGAFDYPHLPADQTSP